MLPCWQRGLGGTQQTLCEELWGGTSAQPGAAGVQQRETSWCGHPWGTLSPREGRAGLGFSSGGSRAQRGQREGAEP